MNRLGGLTALVLLVPACNCGLIAQIEGAPCDTGGVCPSGFVCSGGECHATGGSGGGSGGGGGNDLCSGVVCDMPPAATCKDSSTLETFSGTCSAASGSCDYAPKDTVCTQGCANGFCVGDMCAGMTCNSPPLPHCMNTTLVSSGAGVCANGACKYTETMMDCGSKGCANGACVGDAETFKQVLPRVRHTITAVDQAPASAGTNVVVVGPNAALSSWNGTQWTTVSSTATTSFTSVWFASTTTAFITSDRGLLKWNGSSASLVSGFPALSASSSKLTDVHGRSESDVTVVDDSGSIYRLSSGTWGTTTLSSFSGPYAINGVWIDDAGRIRVYGACGGNACIAYSAAGVLYDVETDGSGTFTAVGPAMDSGNFAWAGEANEVLRRHDPGALIEKFDNIDLPTLPGDGVVVGISPAGGTGRTTWVLTTPGTSSLGSLYRASGTASAPTLDTLSNTFYGFQCLSKTESAGIVFVDTDKVYGSSTIIRRSTTVEEALDLGESWVALAATPAGSVLLNGAGDVALRTGSPTFQLHRTFDNLDARDIAAGTAYAVVVGVDKSTSKSTVQKVPLTQGSAYASLTIPSAPNSLNGICRVSDSEWYIVGESGSIYAFDGSSLHAMTSGTNRTLHDVDCAAAGIAVACGDNGTVLRLSNGTWASVTGAPQLNYTSCKQLGAAIYAAGDDGFARFSGNAWATLSAVTPLTGLAVVSANEIYAASNTSVVRFNGSTWQSIAQAPQTLNAAGLVGNHAVLAGNGGVVMEGQ